MVAILISSMEPEAAKELVGEAVKVLKQNDRGAWIVPAAHLYPHQWLWDSCFVAIGLRHADIDRAQTELISLLRGQWSNGMLPNIIFDENNLHGRDRDLWRSWVNPYSPDNVATSGITQPPMLAEAVVRVGQKLKMPDRRSWYKRMYPALLAYHQWLYADRDPHGEGLVLLIHPYESGLDDSPPWLSELRKHNMPMWINAVERLKLDWVAKLFRSDTRHINSGQRMTNIEAMAYWSALRRLRRKAYNTEALLSRSLFAVEDLAFNCILIRANKHLSDIAFLIKEEVPESLTAHMGRTQTALEGLWDEGTGQYYSRSFVSHKLIEEPTIATLLPLYAGSISKERAERLAELLKRQRMFSPKWPVPTVPVNSTDFDASRYWRGPTWINTNWLIIDGLERYGFKEEAKALREKSVELVAKSGFSEYFNPLNGQPLGSSSFSWTAALTIDFLKG